MPESINEIEQQWYLWQMKALGYKFDKKGQCFGFCCASMNAFLAEEMDVFERRLELIRNTPIKAFKDNFSPWKEKIFTLRRSRQFPEANQIQEDINSILAFFDAIVLYQAPHKYENLLSSEETHSEAFDQSNRLMDFLVRPTVFYKKPAMQPMLVNDEKIIGGYNQQELSAYLGLLQHNLGEHSFSILISCDQHAININFDSKKQCWFLIDPNNLPVKIYHDTNLLAAQLLQNKGTGAIFASSVFVQQRHVNEAREKFLKMQESEEYSKIHAFEEKKANQYQGYRNGEFLDILAMYNILPPTERMILHLCVVGELEILKMYVKSGAVLTNKMILTACMRQQFEVASFLLEKGLTADPLFFVVRNNPEAIKFLLDKGAKLSEELLKKLCSMGGIPIVQYFINAGIMPPRESLELACSDGNLIMAKFLINHGLLPTKEIIDKAVSERNFAILQLFRNIGITVDDGISDTNTAVESVEKQDLENACFKGDFDKINQYLEKGVLLNEELLKKVCERGNLEVAQFIIQKGIKPTRACLEVACVNADMDMIAFLIENHVTPTQKMLALVCSYVDIVEVGSVILPLFGSTDFSEPGKELLPLEEKAIVDMLIFFCMSNRISDVEHFILKGAPVSEGMLLICLQKEYLNVARCLLNCSNVETETDLIGFCCFAKKFSSARLLIECGIKPTEETLKKMCERNHEEGVQFLMDYGLHPSQEIISMAKENGYEKVAYILEQHATCSTEDPSASELFRPSSPEPENVSNNLVIGKSI